MNNALLSGISGLQAHQTMLDVTGNNLANVNTNGFKAGRAHFAELLNRTIEAATLPGETSGGKNPVQVTTGVSISQIDHNMEQGSMSDTGRPMDMAIEGNGYFTCFDGTRNVYTRVGAFAVDADYNLVDPATGNRVLRMGSVGVTEGFQNSYSNFIRIPYDVALPAKVTESIGYTGNLSANEDQPTTNLMTSGMSYTVGGAVVSGTNLLKDLDQANGMANGDRIRITGTRRDGTAVDVTWTIADITDTSNATISGLLAQINAAFTGSTATVTNGEIRVADNAAGYSLTDLNLQYLPVGAGTFKTPAYFKYLEVGGKASKPTNVEIFDSQGIGHTLSADFVKHSDTSNTWDLVLTGITGDVDRLVDRRIHGITFNADGSYGGLDQTLADQPQFTMIFSNDPTNSREITMDFGSTGGFDGLSQFGGASTVAPSGQDGYGPGWLSSVTVTREGTVSGIFTNGIRKDIAALRVTVFQNPAGLESVGKGYYVESSNSGSAIPTRAMSGGAGSVRGGALEKSNVDVATEFVNLIQAQNGYQASARTIRVSNEMLNELSSLIR